MPKTGKGLPTRSRYAKAMTTAAAAAWRNRRLIATAVRKLAGRRKKTRTKTVRKLNVQITPRQEGSSLSFYKKAWKTRLHRRILEKLTPERTHVTTTGVRLEGATGRQVAHSVPQFWCPTISNIFANLVDNASSVTQEVYLKGIEQEYMLSNATNVNMFIKIYECTARNDFLSTTNSTGAYTGYNVAEAAGAFDQGIKETNSGLDATWLGVTPFTSKLFTSMYNVDKVINIELAPGRCHKHQSTFRPRALVKEPRTSRNSLIKGLTRAVMIVAWCGPVNDNTTDTQVSTGKPALNIVLKQSITTQFLNPQGDAITLVNSLGTVTNGVVMSEEGVEQVVTES